MTTTPTRSGSLRGSRAPCRCGVGVQRRAMEAEHDPGRVCRAGETHDVGGRAVGLAHLRHDRCPAFDGVFESSREHLRTRHHALLDPADSRAHSSGGRCTKEPREVESRPRSQCQAPSARRLSARSSAAGPGRASSGAAAWLPAVMNIGLSINSQRFV